MAVISLVVLAPPADRLLRRLSWRQFLLGVCGWCGYTLAAWIWPFLFDLRLVGGCLLLGAVLLQRAAARANTQPMRLPKALRMLVAAQAAVQIGLVIPYSALYFGNYSVAGTVVNMLAIPLSGFLVPSYLAVGLVGLVPGGIGTVLGTVAALPARALTQILCTTAIIAQNVTPFPLMPLPSSTVLVAYFCVPTLLVLYAQTGRLLALPRLRARVPVALGLFSALLLAWGLVDSAYQRLQPARLLIPDMTASTRRPTVPHAILLQGHRATLIGRCSEGDMRYTLTPILRAFGLPRVTASDASAAAPTEFASAAGIVVQKEAHYTLIRQASPARPIMLVPSVADLKALAKQAGKTPLPMLDTLILPWHVGASRSHAAFRDSATTLVLVTSPRTVIVCDGAQLESLQAFRDALHKAGRNPELRTTADTGLLTLRLNGAK